MIYMDMNKDKIPTAEDWLNDLPLQTLTDELKEDIIDKFEEEKIKFAKLHVKAALEAASEQAVNKVQPSDMEEWEIVPKVITSTDLEEHEDFWIEIDKNSILNSYPEDNIK